MEVLSLKESCGSSNSAPVSNVTQSLLMAALKDWDQTSSTLSPFAQPFMPRDPPDVFQPLALDVTDPPPTPNANPNPNLSPAPLPSPTPLPEAPVKTIRGKGDTLQHLGNDPACERGIAPQRRQPFAACHLLTLGGDGRKEKKNASSSSSSTTSSSTPSSTASSSFTSTFSSSTSTFSSSSSTSSSTFSSTSSSSTISTSTSSTSSSRAEAVPLALRGGWSRRGDEMPSVAVGSRRAATIRDGKEGGLLLLLDEEEEEAALLGKASASCLLVLALAGGSSQRLDPALPAGSLPVGFERGRGKPRSASQSSVCSSASSADSGCSSAESVDGGEYDMFGGQPLWGRLYSLTDDILHDTLAEKTDTFYENSSFFSSPGADRAEGRGFARRVQQPTADSDPARAKRAGDDADNRPPKKAPLSRVGEPMTTSQELRQEEADPRRNNSCNPQPGNGGVADSKRTLRASSQSVTESSSSHGVFPRRRRSSSTEDHAQDDASVEERGSADLTEADVWNLSDDGDTTLLADSLTDENGNVLVNNIFQGADLNNCHREAGMKHGWWWSALDTNGNVVDVAESRDPKASRSDVGCKGGWKGGLRCARRSNDSGLGSLSELRPDPDPEPEASPEGSRPPCPRLCPRHAHQPLTLYCTDCCQTLCAYCFATDHMDCARVLATSLACRDLRWQLLRMQSRLGAHIQELESKVQELKPRTDVVARLKKEAKEQVDDRLIRIIKEVRAKHVQVLEEVEGGFRAMERQTRDSVRKAEKSLLLFHYVSEFLDVLRQRDSGWELLSTYDRRLSRLLQGVMRAAASSLDSAQPSEESNQRSHLDSCQATALGVVFDVLNTGSSDDFTEERSQQSCASTPSEGRESHKAGTFTDDFYSNDWGSLQQGFSGMSDRSCERERGSEVLREAAYAGDCESKAESSAPSLNVNASDDQEGLLRDILTYIKRFPPPSAHLPVSSTASSLYSEMVESPGILSPSDLVDDVFQYDDHQHDAQVTFPSNNDDVSANGQHAMETSEYRIQQRLCPDFPLDAEKPFVTDLHVTETGRLVFLDAANHCLKRVDLRQPSNVPVRLPVPQPLSMCSAGWERVMVSCAGRALGLYSVSGKHVRLVATRSTRQQYRGLVRASDALVAAASPETRSVDLLDLGGRVLRSIMPVDFVRGPEVVGCTRGGELLVVHQPATPPTTLLCFDMGGHVLWEHEMRTRTRHVSCSKVVGGADGCVYYALQGDSTVYRICPKSGEETVLLTSKRGVKFPSCLAVDEDGRVLVTRNELPSVHFATPSRQPMLPTTTEIDIYAPDARNNK